MKRLILFFSFYIAAVASCVAQDILGFPREDFGNVVLSSKQWAGSELEGNIGNYNNEPISNYDRRSIFFRLGGPVGRLDILTNVRVFPCTAFLISSNRLMTNYHCVPGILQVPEIRELGATRIEAVQLVLGYTREGVEDDVRRFTVSPAPLEAEEALDYAILEVFGEPGKAFGELKLASVEPFEDAPLWIIGHPLGEAQRISREQCKSGNPALSGGQLRHSCDTLPGNSGSPVIDPDSRTVIALHHAGSKRNSVNYAIPITAIVEQSPILQELMRQDGEKVAVGITDQSAASLASPTCDGVEVSLASGDNQCIKPGSSESFKECPKCPEMVVVPAGQFMMSLEGRGGLEGSQHAVTIPRPFAVGKFEVTFAEWNACVSDGGCRYKPEDEGWGRGKRPVINVSWNDITSEYLPWLSRKAGKPYRLLTEAEWEYAARAGTATRYSFGDSASALRDYGWYALDKTHPVGTKKPNVWGLYDVHGNVQEWVQDCFKIRYEDLPRDGSAAKETSGCKRVYRGGSWNDFPQLLSSAGRDWLSPVNRNNTSGFRVARTL